MSRFGVVDYYWIIHNYFCSHIVYLKYSLYISISNNKNKEQMNTFSTFYKTIYDSKEYKVYFNKDLKKRFIQISGATIFVSQKKIF